MGARGPKPTPTAILENRGSWLAKTRKGEPVAEQVKPSNPVWLDNEDAKAKFEELASSLSALGVLQSTDADTLARYCFWHGKFIYLVRTGQDMSDLCKVEVNLQKLGSSLGLSPADRTRVSIIEKPKEKKDKFLRVV